MKKKIFPLFFCILLFLDACTSKAIPANTGQTEDDANLSASTQTDEEPGDDLVDASITNPVAAGQWLESCRYSSVDDDYHTIYFRVSNILRNETLVRSVLDAYTDVHEDIVFPVLEDDDLQYILMEYEVYFPDTFPETDTGIPDADLIFNIVAPADTSNDAASALSGTDQTDASGEGQQDASVDDSEKWELMETDNRDYQLLTNVYDLTDKPESGSLYAGDTWKNGKAVFVLDRTAKDFLIRYCYYLNEDPVACYISVSQ